MALRAAGETSCGAERQALEPTPPATRTRLTVILTRTVWFLSEGCGGDYSRVMTWWPTRRLSPPLAALAFTLGACGGDSAPENPASPWTSLGTLSFAEEAGQQLSPEIRIEGGGAGFAVFVEVEGCVQVARLETDRRWVESLEGGPSCRDCPERFSLAAGSGLFVHQPPAPVEGPARLRFGSLSCSTLSATFLDGETPPDRLRVWSRALPSPAASASIELEFRHGPFSSSAPPHETARLLNQVQSLMAPSALSVTVTKSEDDPNLPTRLEWFEGAPAALEALVPEATGEVEVVFAGCIERVFPAVGSRTTLDGLVPRIPTFGARGGGVFLRGRECFGASTDPIPWPTEVLARRLAHELGHFLGLYHSREASGLEDRLPDTGDDTLMLPNPSLAPEAVFSPLQAERMRRHARIVAEGLPPAR